MIKLTILLRRRKDMSVEDFIRYHQNVHVPLFESLPEVKKHVCRYTQFYPSQDPLSEFPLSEYDGVTTLWLDDPASLYLVFGSDSYIQIIVPSEKKFLEIGECSVNLN